MSLLKHEKKPAEKDFCQESSQKSNPSYSNSRFNDSRNLRKSKLRSGLRSNKPSRGNSRTDSSFKLAYRAAIICAWLLIWYFVSVLIGNKFLLCSPLEALEALIQLLQSSNFWTVVSHSFVRISCGFVSALILGILLGSFAGKVYAFQAFMQPLIHIIKSAPVVCVIALLLVVAGSKATTPLVVFMVSFPPFYFAVIEAYKKRKEPDSSSKTINEMLHVFKVNRVRRLVYVYWPQSAPFLRAASKTAIGMSWKSGVTCELITLPDAAIGTKVYLAKLSLDMPQIIAWTSLVILLAWLCEKLALLLIDASLKLPHFVLQYQLKRSCESNFARKCENNNSDEGNAGDKLAQKCENSDGNSNSNSNGDGDGNSNGNSGSHEKLNAANEQALQTLNLQNLTKSFGDTCLFSDVSLCLSQDEKLCLMAPSGSGKTTFLRILAGLETPSSGSISCTGHLSVSMIFQETSLLETLTAAENLALTTHNKKQLSKALQIAYDLFPSENKHYNEQTESLKCSHPLDYRNIDYLNSPVSQLSGGQQRRIEIARALAMLEPNAESAIGPQANAPITKAKLSKSATTKPSASKCAFQSNNTSCALLLMDEAFAGLDAANKENCAQVILRNLPHKNCLLIFSTHSQMEAQLLGAKIAPINWQLS